MIYFYAVVALCLLSAGLSMVGAPHAHRDLQRGARLALVAPVWPLALPYWLYLLVRHLWWLADWRNTR